MSNYFLTGLIDQLCQVFAARAGRKPKRHTMGKNRMCHRHRILDRGGQPPCEQGAGAAGHDKGLRGTWSGAPDNIVADIVAGLSIIWSQGTDQVEDEFHHAFAHWNAAQQFLGRN